MILMLFQGLSGILGGIGLIGDPSGRSLQIPLEWLEGSPFNNYMIPGIILLLILGLYPLIVFYGLLKRQSWSWFGALITSVALIIWIAVEILIIGYQPQPPLQLIYGAVGFIMLVLVLMPSVQMYYQHKEIHEI
jgi:hypothetical protein